MKQQCCQIGINEQLLLYLDRSLGKCEHAAVARHLKECPRCDREYGMLQIIIGQLSDGFDLLRTAQGFGGCIPPATLVELAAGELFSEARIDAFKRHMQECKSCRDEFILLARLQRM